MTDSPTLDAPLTLPCGQVLPNRLAKSALAEALAEPDGAPGGRLERLYARWAESGAGLLLTGNVMIDPAAMGEPGDVVVEDERHLAALSRWAAVAKAGGARVWMQINHPGRQSFSAAPVAPSAVPLKVGGGAFIAPRELTSAEVEAIVARFGRTAAVARAAGFDGVQLHAAHGYLVSQFLSPLTNLRTDAWGGDAERRRAFLLAVVAEIRRAVGSGFPIGVKLNSADFQKGGFAEEDALGVARALEEAGVDLLEISGGTYERAAMMGAAAPKDSTRRREAYFLDFAARVREAIATPLMLTGGFRTRAGMAEALASGAIDVVGLGRPLARDAAFPRRLLAGETDASPDDYRRTGVAALDGFLELAWYQHQLRRMGDGKAPEPGLSPWWVLGERLLELGPHLWRRSRG